MCHFLDLNKLDCFHQSLRSHLVHQRPHHYTPHLPHPILDDYLWYQILLMALLPTFFIFIIPYLQNFELPISSMVKFQYFLVTFGQVPLLQNADIPWPSLEAKGSAVSTPNTAVSFHSCVSYFHNLLFPL